MNSESQEFQYSVVSSFLDSAAGLVLSSYMVHFSPSIKQRNNCEANDLDVVWWTNCYVLTDAC